MTDSEILTKAIEKAINNGFRGFRDEKYIRLEWNSETQSYWESWPSVDEEGEPYMYEAPFCPSDNDLIFSHDFAKAFWGEEPYIKFNSYEKLDGQFYEHGYKMSFWQYHLQQLVLLPENERIKYLEKFI